MRSPRRRPCRRRSTSCAMSSGTSRVELGELVILGRAREGRAPARRARGRDEAAARAGRADPAGATCRWTAPPPTRSAAPAGPVRERTLLMDNSAWARLAARRRARAARSPPLIESGRDRHLPAVPARGRLLGPRRARARRAARRSRRPPPLPGRPRRRAARARRAAPARARRPPPAAAGRPPRRRRRGPPRPRRPALRRRLRRAGREDRPRRSTASGSRPAARSSRPVAGSGFGVSSPSTR